MTDSNGALRLRDHPQNPTRSAKNAWIRRARRASDPKNAQVAVASAVTTHIDTCIAHMRPYALRVLGLFYFRVAWRLASGVDWRGVDLDLRCRARARPIRR